MAFPPRLQDEAIEAQQDKEKEMPQPSQPTTQQTQINIHTLVILTAVAIVFYGFGAVSGHGAAFVLSAVGQGLENAANWLARPLDNPAAYHSGSALQSYRDGDDPELFSPSERSRLNKGGEPR